MKKTIKELSKEDTKVVDLFTTAIEHCDAQVRRLNKEGNKEGLPSGGFVEELARSFLT